MPREQKSIAIARREFLTKSARMALLGVSAPTLLAACAAPRGQTAGDATATAAPTPRSVSGGEGRAVVGDVLDFSLIPDGWKGDFGWVDLKLHRGSFNGNEVHFIRTDTSDPDLAGSEGLVLVPKIASLATKRLSGEIFLFDDDHPAVLSSEPGRHDYTPAWRVRHVSWNGASRSLGSVEDVRSAESDGDVRIEATRAVLNAAVVKWSSGEMPTDSSLEEYLGGGQLVEAPDTGAGKVRFKLHECFPGVRYIVSDTSMKPMADGMNIVYSPRLGGSSKVGATGRTNVFMNGIEGPGPMGFQPSVFDSVAGAAEWSPYWDHMTYSWKDDSAAEVLSNEEDIHERRDAGDLEEFPGTPDTGGEIFTVNCQVPVIAPNTFTG